jgi:hypothetical protein
LPDESSFRTWAWFSGIVLPEVTDIPSKNSAKRFYPVNPVHPVLMPFSFFELNSLPAQRLTPLPLAANFAILPALLKSSWLGNCPATMSDHAYDRVWPWTVRPLGVRPQELFVLTTDGHRSSEALPSCTRLGVGKTLWRGISLVAPVVLLSVLICVNLWLKNFLLSHEKPANSFAKICENPCKIHDRQPSSTPKLGGGPPGLPFPQPFAAPPPGIHGKNLDPRPVCWHLLWV